MRKGQRRVKKQGDPARARNIGIEGARVGFTAINKDNLARVKEFALTTGMDNFNDVLTKLLEDCTREKVVGEIKLEDAAKILLGALEENQRLYVEEHAKDIVGCPVWQMILSCVLKNIEDGTLNGVHIYANWDTISTVVVEGIVCPNCEGMFKPHHLGQKFCCTPCALKRDGHDERCCLLDKKELMALAAKD